MRISLAGGGIAIRDEHPHSTHCQKQFLAQCAAAGHGRLESQPAKNDNDRQARLRSDIFSADICLADICLGFVERGLQSLAEVRGALKHIDGFGVLRRFGYAAAAIVIEDIEQLQHIGATCCPRR